MGNRGSKQFNYIAIGDFNKTSEAEINIKKNDKLLVLDTSVAEWYIAINLRTGCKGYVPSKYVALKDSLDAKEWYFKNCTRLDAELLLEYVQNEPGTFLIRESERFPDKMALSVLVLNSGRARIVNHNLIKKSKENRFFIHSEMGFNTLDELVKYYSDKRTRGPVNKLIKPCPKEMDVPGVQGIWEEKRDNIEMKEKIGSGVSGEVFKGMWRKNYAVAVKVVKTSENLKITRESMLNEADKMKDLKHKNIVKLWCVCTVDDPILIVTELMHHGSLLDYLKLDRGDNIQLKHIVAFALHIATGMRYLANKKYVHCDLAARNVLVNERFIAKISDFGLTQKVDDDDVVEVIIDEGNSLIPVKWTAPEVLSTREKNGKKVRSYRLKSDVWSYGIVLYEMIVYGQAPYPGIESKEVGQKVINEHYRMPQPNGICTDYYYEIMRKCWHEDPDSRPDFNSLCDIFDNFFTNNERQYNNETDH